MRRRVISDSAPITGSARPTVIAGAVITASTGPSSAARSCASSRTTSRSDRMPATISPSITGTAPIRWVASSSTACATVAPRRIVTTGTGSLPRIAAIVILASSYICQAADHVSRA